MSKKHPKKTVIIFLLLSVLFILLYLFNKFQKDSGLNSTTIVKTDPTNQNNQLESDNNIPNTFINENKNVVLTKKDPYDSLDEETKALFEKIGYTREYFNIPLHDLCNKKIVLQSELQKILDSGIDINKKNFAQAPALFTLLSNSQNAPELLEFFKTNGADFDYKYSNNEILIDGVPLTLDIISATLRNPYIETKNELLKTFESQGYSITSDNIKTYIIDLLRPNNTALAKKHISVQMVEENPMIFDLMLKKKSSNDLISFYLEQTKIDFSGEEHKHLMHFATSNPKINNQIFEELIKNGADINAVTAGETPLMVASFSGYIDKIKILLKYGADKNYTNHLGKTALTNHIEPKFDFVDKKIREEINGLLKTD